MRVCILAVILSISFACHGVSTASAEEDPAVGQVRKVDPWTGETTSDCIGDPKTVVCAVDTIMACLALVKLDLCEIAGARFFGPIEPGELKYVIKEIRALSHTKDACIWEGTECYFDGANLVAAVIDLEPPDNEWDPGYGVYYPFVFILQQVDGRWIRIGKFTGDRTMLDAGDE